MKLSHEQLLDILCIFLEVDGQPTEAISGMRAAFASPRTTSDLKDFLHHSIRFAPLYPANVRQQIEALLKSKGLPALEQLDTGFRNTCVRILKRGHIRDEEEFYIVAEVLGGHDYHELSPAEQKRLGELSYAFEKTRRKA